MNNQIASCKILNNIFFPSFNFDKNYVDLDEDFLPNSMYA